MRLTSIFIFAGILLIATGRNPAEAYDQSAAAAFAANLAQRQGVIHASL